MTAFDDRKTAAEDKFTHGEVHRWEYDLEEAIYQDNRSLRLDFPSGVDWPQLRAESKALGIGEDRVKKIVLATQVDLSWDVAVRILVNRGMDKEAAEDAVEKLAIDIWASRTLRGSLAVRARWLALCHVWLGRSLECDHVTPLEREPGQDPYDPNGLQTLCRRCHIQKTARENRRSLTPAEAAWQALVVELLCRKLGGT